MNQTIYHGIEHLGEALNGSTKVLLVCDKSFPFFRKQWEEMHILVVFEQQIIFHAIDVHQRVGSAILHIVDEARILLCPSERGEQGRENHEKNTA